MFTATPQNDVQYRQTFFSSSILSPGTHTLVITTLEDKAFYYFDYIRILLDPLPWPLLQPTSPISTNSLTSLDTSSQASTTLLATPSLSNTSSVAAVTLLSAPTVSSQSRMTTRIFSAPTTEPSSIPSSAQTSQVPVSSSHISPALTTGVVIGGLGLTLVFFFVVYRLKSQLSQRAAMNIYGSCKIIPLALSRVLLISTLAWTTNLPNRTSVMVPYLLTTMAPSQHSGKHDDRRQPQPEMGLKQTRGTV